MCDSQGGKSIGLLSLLGVLNTRIYCMCAFMLEIKIEWLSGTLGVDNQKPNSIPRKQGVAF